MPTPSAPFPTSPDGRVRHLTICVRPDASVETLHNDGLGLDALGPMEVRRASHVEYDEGRQEWYVEDAATGERLFAEPSRGRCLDWEADHYNAALRNGLQPFAR